MDNLHRNAILFITALRGERKNNCGLRNKILLQAGLCYSLGTKRVMPKASEIHKSCMKTDDLKRNMLITGCEKISK